MKSHRGGKRSRKTTKKYMKSHRGGKRSRKTTKKYKKSYRGGGSDWGHTNYSRVVGASDAGEASRFKHFTTAEFEAPSQLAKDAGLSSPSNGVMPNDPIGNSYATLGN
jgi:hypothetical protein